MPAKGVESFVDKARKSLDSFGTAATKVGTAMSVGLTIPLTLLGKQVITAGSSFESAFAGVRKTLDATEPELASLRQAFRDMAKEIPISANELAKIGEAAGALGVRKEDILSFTRTMADLGVTTNLTSDQAANGLARIANIMKNEAGPQYDRLGATLVALGNAGASTEAEILEMSLRIAGAGKVAGLSEADILSFANALSSVGIEAEAGGTAISRVFLAMNDAVKLGGKELQVFAQTAGLSAAQFKQAFETDAAGAAIAFIEGLGKITAEGKSLTPVLAELELNEIRVRDALLRASGAGDLFRESLQLGSKAWQENSALTKEAAERYKTFDSQVQLLKNQLTDVGITIFEQVRPALVSMVEGIKGVAEWVGKLDPKLIQMGITAAAVFAVSGPILVGIGKVSTALAALGAGAAGGPITLAIAGVAALAAAYATNFGQMKRTLDDFVQNWGTGTTQTGKDWQTFGNVLVKGFIILSQGFDTIITSVQMLGNAVVAFAKAFLAVWRFDFSGAIQAWKDYDAKAREVMAEHLIRAKARMSEFEDVGRGWAQAAGKGYAANLNLKAPTQKEIDQMTGPMRVLMEQRFGGLGRSAIAGWDSATRRSPFFMIHDLMLAVQFMDGLDVQIAPKMSKAAKAMVKAWKAEFKDITESLNDWLRDHEVTANLTEEVWKKMSKGVQQTLIGLSKAHKTVQDEITRITIEETVRQNNAVEISITQWNKFSAQAKKAVKDLGVEIKLVFPAIVKEIQHLDDFVVALGQNMAGSAKSAEEWAKQIGDAAEKGFDKFNTALQQNINFLAKWKEAFKQASPEQIIKQSFDKIADIAGKGVADLIKVVLSGLGELNAKTAAQTAKWAEGILQVVGGLPGKLGDKLRSVTSTILEWINGIDQVLKGLHKIFDAIPDGLGKAIESVIGIFKGNASKLESILDDVFGPVIKEATTLDKILDEVFGPATGIGSAVSSQVGQVERGSSRMVNAISAIGTAAAFAGAAIGGRTGAVLSGAGAGASLGAQIGFVFGGPVGAGIGTVVGAAAGALAGWFGSAKSQLQKAQEAAALQQAKDAVKISMQNVLQAVEQTKQSILSTVSQARDIIESIRFHTSIGKEPMKAFFKDLHQFMMRLAGEASTWKGFAGEQTKKAIEDLSAGVDLIAKIPAAFFAIATHLKVPEVQFDKFFADLTSFWDRFGLAVEDWSNKTGKKIRKIANFLAPAVDLISPLTEGMKAMLDLKGVPDAAFDVMEAFLDTLTARYGILADKADKGTLKAIEFFASKVSSVVELSKSTIELIKSAVDVKAPSAADIENIFSALTAFINRAVQMTKETTTEGLLLAANIASAIVPLANGLKSWVDFSVVARDYTAIAASVWDALVADFQKGLQLLHLLIADALIFVDEAKLFDDLMTTGTAHLASGFQKFAAALNNSSSLLNGTLSNLNALTAFSSSGGQSSAFSSVGGQSFTSISSPSVFQSSPNFPSSGQGQTVVHITVPVTVQGNLIHTEQVAQTVMRAIVTLVQTGQLPIKSGGSVQFALG